MSIFNKLIGNSVEVEIEKALGKLESILVPGEEVEIAFKLVRDTVVFTNKRIIDIDVQAVTGKKKQVHTIPYSKINYFSVESGGTFDMDSELKVYVSGRLEPFSWEFKKDNKIFDVCKLLSYYTLER